MSQKQRGKEESTCIAEVNLLMYLNMVTLYLLKLSLGDRNLRDNVKLIDLTMEKNMTQNAGLKANWFK